MAYGAESVGGAAGVGQPERAAAGRKLCPLLQQAFDALVDSGARAFDPAAARRYFTDAYSVIDADAPAVWLYEAKNTSAVSRRVKVAGTRPDAWWSGLPDWTVSAR